MPRVRPSVCADDRWYPSDPKELERRLDELLSEADVQPPDGELVALISPHAGYRFSGPTAAFSYKLILPDAFRRVILVGPSHFADYGPQAVNDADAFETPLGLSPVDAATVKALDRQVGIWFVASDHEHSLEIQVPFLQRQLKEFTLVPLMMSHPFYHFGVRVRNECETLSYALAPLLEPDTLLVASSDLSHLHDYESVVYFDQGFDNLISEYDIGGLIDYMVNEGEPRACGDMAIITTLLAAKLRGANAVKVLHRTNSGDVLGVREPGQYTVGYMAAAVYVAKRPEHSPAGTPIP